MTLSEKTEINKQLFEKKYGDIILPTRIVDKGEKMTVRFESYEGENAALVITHNCSWSCHGCLLPVPFKKKGQ